MAFRLTPQDTSFFDLLTASAQYGVEAARLVTELLAANRSERQQIVDRLREVESAADESTHAVVRKVNESFITPFDHVDIVDLAAALDTCVDELEAVGAMVLLYRIEEIPAGTIEVIGVISRMAELTAEAMPRLRSLRDLKDYWIEINRLENQADVAYRRMIAELFDGTLTDAIELLKRKEVVDGLETAADAFESVAHHVETIAVKES